MNFSVHLGLRDIQVTVQTMEPCCSESDFYRTPIRD